MAKCKKCGSRLESVLVCDACDGLQDPPSRPGPFDVFGLPPAFALDQAALKKRLLALSRKMHPDFFGAAEDRERELAQHNTAELNSAHEILADAFRRADHLVRALGGPGEEDERKMPQAFLLEVLEWNETLEEAREAAPDSPTRERLAALEATLRSERGDAMQRVGALFDPLPEPGTAALTELRRELNAVRYLDRTLSTLGEIRLEQASRT